MTPKDKDADWLPDNENNGDSDDAEKVIVRRKKPKNTGGRKKILARKDARHPSHKKKRKSPKSTSPNTEESPKTPKNKKTAATSPDALGKWARCRAGVLTSLYPEKGKVTHDKIEQLLQSTSHDDCTTLSKALYGELIHRIARFYCQNWKRDHHEIHHLNRVFNIESAVKSAMDNIKPVSMRKSLNPEEIYAKVTPILVEAFAMPEDTLRPGTKEWLYKKRKLEEFTVEDVNKYDQLRYQWIALMVKEYFDPETGKPRLEEGIITLSHLCMHSVTAPLITLSHCITTLSQCL